MLGGTLAARNATRYSKSMRSGTRDCGRCTSRTIGLGYRRIWCHGFDAFYSGCKKRRIPVARMRLVFRLHPLKGGRAGQWSVRVSGNWRVVFRFEDGEAVDVDLVDYH